MFSFKKKNTPESVAKEKAAFIESIRNKYKGQEEFVLTDEEAAVVGRPSFIKKLRSFENGAIFEKVSGIYRLGDNIKDYPNFVVCVGAYVTEYPKMYENFSIRRYSW